MSKGSAQVVEESNKISIDPMIPETDSDGPDAPLTPFDNVKNTTIRERVEILETQVKTLKNRNFVESGSTDLGSVDSEITSLINQEVASEIEKNIYLPVSLATAVSSAALGLFEFYNLSLMSVPLFMLSGLASFAAYKIVSKYGMTIYEF